jgi:hypothetical protein
MSWSLQNGNLFFCWMLQAISCIVLDVLKELYLNMSNSSNRPISMYTFNAFDFNP